MYFLNSEVLSGTTNSVICRHVSSQPDAVVLYRVQPIRPRTTSDSSRNIFGHALARAEEAKGKRNSVEMGLVSSYQFENSNLMLHRSSGCL